MKRLIRGRVNIGQPSYTPLAYVNQLDDITLELDIYNSNSLLDVTGQTVSLYAKRSNTTVVEQLSGLSTASTKVTGDVKNSCFAVPGITEMQLEFTDSTGKTTVSSFYINVNKSLSSEDSITAGNEIAILTEAKEQEPIRQRNETERIKNETARGQAETNRAAAEEIREQQELARQTCYKEIEESRMDFDGGVHKNLKLRLMRDFGDIYERFNKANLLPYEAEYISASNSYKGMTKDNVVKGRTLQNISGDMKIQANGAEIVDNTVVIDTTSNSIDGGIQFKGANLVKPSTTYTLIYTILTNENYSGMLSLDGNSVYCFNLKALPLEVGKHCVLVTSKSAWTSDLYKIATTTVQGKGKLILKDEFMLLEGDWTNKQIPNYFEGIRSVNEDVENLEVVSCGKNLFNESLLKNGEIVTFNGKRCYRYVDSANHFMYQGYFKLNTQYTLQLTAYREDADVSKAFNIRFVYTDGTRTDKALTSGNKLILVSDKNKVISHIQGSFNFSSYVYIDLDTCQLEEGAVATSYEPYVEDRLPIKMKNLRGLPNGTCDTSDGVRRIEKIVLNGSESNWISIGNLINTCGFALKIVGAVKKNDHTNIVCDKFASKLIYSIDEEGVFMNHAPNLIVRVLKSKLSTQDIIGFKAWLQTNPITVYYELETPTKEEGNTEELRTYDGQTNIFTEGSLIEPTISCKIPSNVQAVVMSLRNENEALNNDVNTLQATTEENNLMNIETNVNQEARLTMLELGVI